MIISLAEADPATNALPYLSYSRVDLFTKCPESYRKQYVEGVRGAPTAPLATGSMTHAIIGAYYQSLISRPRMAKSEREQTSLDAAGDVMVGIIDEARARHQTLAFGKDPDELEEEAVELGKTYIKNRPKHIKPLAVEKKIEVDLGPDVPPLIGYVDLEAETSIVEVKTSKNSVPKPSGAWILQARIYQAAIPKPAEFHVLVKTATPKLLTSSALAVAYDPDATRAALGIARYTAKRIQHLLDTVGPDNPWPMSGVAHPWACSMCDARHDCLLGRAA